MNNSDTPVRSVTIQLGAGPEQRRPYPWHIAVDGEMAGSVLRQDFWRGTPGRLLGFQEYAKVQRVNLHTRDWLADVQRAVGMYPVFVDDDGTMWNTEVAIATVTEPGGEEMP